MFTRSKVKGMMIGGAIGDALGAPVETWGPDRITEVHGKLIDRYVAPIGHKWFKPEEFLPGMTTDDTQLTVAVMEGLIDGQLKNIAKIEAGQATEIRDFGLYLDGIAQRHVVAMKSAIGGWGKSTVEAVRRLANGVHWIESGKTTESNRGTGNGVPMKVAPMAAWLSSDVGVNFKKDRDSDYFFHFNQRMVDLSGMTHYTDISAYATIVHANTLNRLLRMTSSQPLCVANMFDMWSHLEKAKDVPNTNESYFIPAQFDKCKDNFWERLHDVYSYMRIVPRDEQTVERTAKEFGGGSCYVNDSLPFSYAMFLRGPNDFKTILETINAGGDNDTNGKFVGEMLGAYHGIEFFQNEKWACEGLRDYQKILDLTDKFCDTFGIK